MESIIQPASSAPNVGENFSFTNSVLVADDDPIFRRLLRSWLEKWNYQVDAVENGLDAWKVLQQEDAPQMAILDWMMPGIDGIELCRKLRNHQHGRYRYVLLITAKDEKQDVVAGLDAGADDYLTKPFDVNELRGRIRAGSRILQLQDALLRAQEKLQFEAAHDALTGLWNRGAILDFLQREASRHGRTSDPLGIIMADLDHFKRINDDHGHLAGDIVLREVAKRMVSAVRNYDFVGRYGGEEFLIIVPGCATEALTSSAERMRLAVCERPVESEIVNLSVTLSLGLVSASPRSPEFHGYEALLAAADAALYCAKANGRNRVEVAAHSLAASGSGTA
jgi:two-component system cell cycle response regulator